MLLFLIFWSEHIQIQSQSREKRQIVHLFELTLILWLWRWIWACSDENIKKRSTLCYHTFLQGIQICNQNQRILILKIWPYLTFDPDENADFRSVELSHGEIRFQHLKYYGKPPVFNEFYVSGGFAGVSNLGPPFFWGFPILMKYFNHALATSAQLEANRINRDTTRVQPGANKLNPDKSDM